MLVEIADEVAEREAVVRGDEIDALGGIGLVGKGVLAAGDAACEGQGSVVVTEPETARVVAEFAVPFGPCFGETADFVEAAGVPGFGDELASAQHRVVRDIAEQPEIRVVDPLAFVRAPEDCREIEAETVHMHLDEPVAQAFDDEMFHGRVVAVHRVAAAGVIRVFAALFEHVIDGVVEALERDGRPVLSAFAAVVEDDIEDDFDLSLVKCTHHLSEFGDDCAGRAVECVALMRREETERGVSPVIPVDRVRDRIDERRGLEFVELCDGQQFDRGDAEFLEVRYLVDKAEKSSGFCGHRRGVRGHAFDMAFINDAFGERVSRAHLVIPVHRGALHGDGFCGRARAIHIRIGDIFERGVPVERIERVIEHIKFADDRMRVRVKQELVGIEAVPDERLVRAVHAPSVKLSRLEALHMDVPDVAGPVSLGIKRDAV